jgi:hypothetical protein
MTRRLALRKETLTDLTAADLALVAGGQTGISEPVYACFGITRQTACDSLLQPCVSNTCTQ